MLDVLKDQRAAARTGGEEAAGRLIDMLRDALAQNPGLTEEQLQTLCDAFWRGEQ